MEQQVQKIEGISPDMIWTFLVVLVGLMALVVLGDKVMDVYRKAKKSREEQTELQNSDVTDRIADKVMENVSKGTDVVVTGVWKTGSYKNQKGDTVYTNEVLADNVAIAL